MVLVNCTYTQWDLSYASDKKKTDGRTDWQTDGQTSLLLYATFRGHKTHVYIILQMWPFWLTVWPIEPKINRDRVLAKANQYVEYNSSVINMSQENERKPLFYIEDPCGGPWYMFLMWLGCLIHVSPESF